jgi:hypothetical protein
MRRKNPLFRPTAIPDERQQQGQSGIGIGIGIGIGSGIGIGVGPITEKRKSIPDETQPFESIQ